LSDEVTISHIADYRQKKLFVQLEAEKYPAEIHYTLDGTKPVAHSPLYRNPIPITDSKIISAQLFKEGKALGKETSQ
jgi:hexosaminidase